MLPANESISETCALLAKLRAFCFPGGEDAARIVRAIRTEQQGEMRQSPSSRWIPFTAKETVETGRSWFHWQARYRGGSKGLVSVTDAYEDGQGRIVVRIGGIIPVQKAQGPEVDKGELQRYLSSVILCPPILVNHGSLEWSAVGPLTLRVRDREDPTGAAVDLDVGEDGRPLLCRADRPRMVGKQPVVTPWSATGTAFKECSGFRAATRIEVSWHLPEGQFTYYRSEVVSLEILH